MQEVAESRLDEQHQIAKMIIHSILSAQENERKWISRERTAYGVTMRRYTFKEALR
ncbi:hypothetical protein [Paenibacillus popilliae]|uniref:hypothetical protein n=1 Tax=Paenibacillus popilliae TaxID=78057 RepID=UPI0002F877EC|nr:hypothetical protein [Paenibacillus popilliae]